MPSFEAYALAKGSRDGRARGRRRQQQLQRLRAQPVEFLTDRARFPLLPATTTDVGKAHVWRSRQGPYEFLKRRPALKKQFFPCPVERPAAAGAA